MPIFEYLCQPCNRIYSFLSLSLSPTREPVCPRCGATGLTRVPSTFAVGSPSKAATDQAPARKGDDAALGRLEQEAMRLASEIDEKDAEDPRTMARMMRRLAEVSGEPVTPAMNEMFRRMEAGEDPEALEEELGPQLEAELGDDGEGERRGPARDDGLYDL